MIRNLLHFILPKGWFQKLYLYRHMYKLVSREDSYLVKTGYVNSVLKLEPVDKSNLPIPWMNYSFLDFLKPRLKPTFEVFEYGSGYSTYYLCDKVKSIVSVEYDEEWFKKVKRELKGKGNVEITYCELSKNYAQVISTQVDKKFDLIFIDGRKRVACALNSIPFLSERGILILDDSWREEYEEIFIHFRSLGFRELSFTGLKAGGLILEKTTLFYREENVLDI